MDYTEEDESEPIKSTEFLIGHIYNFMNNAYIEHILVVSNGTDTFQFYNLDQGTFTKIRHKDEPNKYYESKYKLTIYK